MPTRAAGATPKPPAPWAAAICGTQTCAWASAATGAWGTGWKMLSSRGWNWRSPWPDGRGRPRRRGALRALRELPPDAPAPQIYFRIDDIQAPDTPEDVMSDTPHQEEAHI